MKVRLVKRDAAPEEAKPKEPPPEVQILDNVRGWVEEFKSRKGIKLNLEFRMDGPQKA